MLLFAFVVSSDAIYTCTLTHVITRVFSCMHGGKFNCLTWNLKVVTAL